MNDDSSQVPSPQSAPLNAGSSDAAPQPTLPLYQHSQPYYVPAAPPTYEHKKSKFRWAFPILLLLLAAWAVFGFNYLLLQSPMQSVIDADSLNSGVEVTVHYQNYINLSTLVYDLQKVAGDKSEADVFRVFLQYAEQVQDQRFDTVELAYKGTTKFMVTGDYFEQLGQEYSWQNPIYTTRTFPEHLRLPDGSNAYSQWTGGVLGVTNAQMNDFNDFHKQWYLSDMIAGK
jgi:hypothetical protein